MLEEKFVMIRIHKPVENKTEGVNLIDTVKVLLAGVPSIDIQSTITERLSDHKEPDSD